jgi:hypothetical protein
MLRFIQLIGAFVILLVVVSIWTWPKTSSVLGVGRLVAFMLFGLPAAVATWLLKGATPGEDVH